VVHQEILTGHNGDALKPRPSNSSIRAILILVFLASALTACGPGGDTSTNANQTQSAKTQKKLTIFLIDRSGSFHRIQREGHFRGKDYFYIACDQVKQYVRQEADKQNELIMVRAIQSSSFSDDTFIAKLDYTQSPVFTEPEPQGPYSKEKKKAWANRKQQFDTGGENKQKSSLEAFAGNIDDFRKGKPSGKTDLVNAFRALIPHLEEFSAYSKRIIVYSDFKDTETALEAAGQIDLGADIEVEGRFVSMNEQDPDSYNRLLKQWQSILKCKSTKFKTPAESI